MRRHITIALTLAAALPAASLSAQTIYDTNLRGAPQFVQYKLKTPLNETITEFSLPIYVVVPFNSMFNIDVGTAYTSARVESNDPANPTTSSVSGLTDTQVRGNVTLGTDFVVLTFGVNIPTGQETASLEQQLAAFLIGNDFLAFPTSNMGTGFGATGGIAVARPLGEWNLGVGASMRHSGSYEPFEDNANQKPRFQPGDELRARIGLDHALGTGRFAVAMTYSKFGNDNIGGSIYNTGDRYIAQAGFTNTVGGADVILSGWSLFRAKGTIFTHEPTGPENISNVLLGVGFHTMGGVLEPSIEARNWSQQDLSSSMLATLGLRYTVTTNGFAITPSAGYTTGRYAAASGTADLSGLRAALAIRIGP